MQTSVNYPIQSAMPSNQDRESSSVAKKDRLEYVKSS